MNTRGLESAIRLNKILMGASIKADTLTPTQIIACDGLVDDWAPGSYAVGDVRNYAGQTWRCCQAHDSTSSPEWTPGAEAALWAPYHASEAAYARPWVAPSGGARRLPERRGDGLDGWGHLSLQTGCRGTRPRRPSLCVGVCF